MPFEPEEAHKYSLETLTACLRQMHESHDYSNLLLAADAIDKQVAVLKAQWGWDISYAHDQLREARSHDPGYSYQGSQ